MKNVVWVTDTTFPLQSPTLVLGWNTGSLSVAGKRQCVEISIPSVHTLLCLLRQPDWEDKCLMMISDEFRTELENMFQIFLSWKIHYFHPSEIALWRCDALSCLLCILEKLSLQSRTCITLTWPPHTSLYNSKIPITPIK